MGTRVPGESADTLHYIYTGANRTTWFSDAAGFKAFLQLLTRFKGFAKSLEPVSVSRSKFFASSPTGRIHLNINVQSI